jgi:glycosyltransferase involved in cell wall biosynthesis
MTTSAPATSQAATRVGLVSCICPTYNRREWIPRSINCFLAQDHIDRELLILDDGTDAILDLVPDDSRIRYHRLDRKLTIGAKRNMACEMARGDLIAHWDDDDWYPSWRLTRQAIALLTTDADICGSSQLYYINTPDGKAFRYAYSSRRVWVAGNTLFYKKSFWQRSRFPDLQVGEDTRFIMTALHNRILDLNEAQLCIASIHEQNTSPKITTHTFWKPEPVDTIRFIPGFECAPDYAGLDSQGGRP